MQRATELKTLPHITTAWRLRYRGRRSRSRETQHQLGPEPLTCVKCMKKLWGGAVRFRTHAQPPHKLANSHFLIWSQKIEICGQHASPSINILILLVNSCFALSLSLSLSGSLSKRIPTIVETSTPSFIWAQFSLSLSLSPITIIKRTVFVVSQLYNQ